ncbi:hypothetical protein JST97_11805 [bacterium]|nr:hypothetical protein [bacterium]
MSMRLFLGLFFLFLIALGGLTAAGVAATHHFLHWDISAWTDTSAWNSRSFVVGAVIVAISTAAASAGTLLWRFLMAMIAGATARPKKSRPKSWRRTTT